MPPADHPEPTPELIDAHHILLSDQVPLWDAINNWALGDMETKMREVVEVHRIIATIAARAVLQERAWWKAAIVVTDTDGFAFCELCRRGSWGSDPQQVDHAKHCAVIRRGDDHE